MSSSRLATPKLALSLSMSFRSLKLPPDAVKFMTAPASEIAGPDDGQVHAGAAVDLEPAARRRGRRAGCAGSSGSPRAPSRRGRSAATAASVGSLPEHGGTASTPTRDHEQPGDAAGEEVVERAVDRSRSRRTTLIQSSAMPRMSIADAAADHEPVVNLELAEVHQNLLESGDVTVVERRHRP